MEIKDTAKRANEMLRELGVVRRVRVSKQAQLDKRAQALKDRYGPELEELKQRQDRLTEDLVKLVLPQFWMLAANGTRTIKLRSGQISLRLGNPALVLSDAEAVIIRRIRAHRGLRRFTRLGKRTLDRAALKRDQAFVAKIDGLAIVQQTNVVIRPNRTQGEIVFTDDTLSVPLPKED